MDICRSAHRVCELVEVMEDLEGTREGWGGNRGGKIGRGHEQQTSSTTVDYLFSVP